jgi:hypothetical protein
VCVVRWNIAPKLVVLIALLVLTWPSAADAQVGYPSPYPYRFRYAEPESNLRIAVTPREATVYVDGAFAGTVDDFDGMFQRLHVTPGEHEIAFYLQGYRTIRQKLYLSPNANRKITATMEPLGPGETNEPPPAPAEHAQEENNAPPRPREPYTGRGRIPPPSRGSRPPDAPRLPQDSTPRGGSLVIRVEPADTDISIDGEHWRGPSGDDRLVVPVSEGHHRIEVKKDGYAQFTTEVDVRTNDSLPINVSLAREK